MQVNLPDRTEGGPGSFVHFPAVLGQGRGGKLSFLLSLQIPDLEPAEVNFCPPYAPPRCLPHPSRPSRTAGDRRSLRIWVGRGGSGVCLGGDSAVLSVIAIGVGFLVSGEAIPAWRQKFEQLMRTYRQPFDFEQLRSWATTAAEEGVVFQPRYVAVSMALYESLLPHYS